MRVSCPACETSYDVPEQVLQAGRPLRCARCRNEWSPLPGFSADVATPYLEQDTARDRDEPAPPAEPDPEDALPRLRPPEPPPKPLSRARRAAIITSWIASLLLLGGAGWCAIAWRAPIMHAWPPSARIYAALGYG